MDTCGVCGVSIDGFDVEMTTYLGRYGSIHTLRYSMAVEIDVHIGSDERLVLIW